MKPKKRQKLCCHCEGEVDLDVIVCPFCAADLREEKPEQKTVYNPTSALQNMDMHQSLYPSSYTSKPIETVTADSQDSVRISEPEIETRSLWGPIILMTLGSQLFLFGVLMLLFSDKGALLLKWDARLWFIYILASVPFLIFGYRSVSKL
jgi:hypothetical protein